MNKTAVSAFSFIFMMAAAVGWAAPVPDTGQTKCYNDTVEIPCPAIGQPFFGQDANYLINPMSYTKLDDRGNVLPDSATLWTMVKDNVTGLIWEMKTSMDGVKNDNDPHDADNTYSWYDHNPVTNGGTAGKPGNGTDTEDFIKALNDAHYGGYIDWRLPTIKELEYIVNYRIPSPGPTSDIGYFNNTQASFYWSATTYAEFSDYAWGVDFSYGSNEAYSKNSYGYIRAVRGGQSEPLADFTDNGDGTVTDTSTGLMWQQATPGNAMTWKTALAYCGTLDLGNNKDWRLPTIKELKSLVKYIRYHPAINTTFFPDTISKIYWSATTAADVTGYAWCIDFYDGYNYNDGFKLDYDTYYVRAVRGGQMDCTPDTKANGQDGQITVASGTPLSITASLAPGKENGKLSDWWLACSTPWGWYSLSSNGWTPGIYLLAQYPLFSVSPVEVYSSPLPVGDYTFYFLVDTSPNGFIDSPFFYDFVQVHVINTNTTQIE